MSSEPWPCRTTPLRPSLRLIRLCSPLEGLSSALSASVHGTTQSAPFLMMTSTMSIGTPVTPHWTDTANSRHSTFLLSALIPSSSLPRRSSSLIALYSLSPSRLVSPHLDLEVSAATSQYPNNKQLPHPPLDPPAAEDTTANSTPRHMATGGEVRSPRSTSEVTTRERRMSNRPLALLLNGRSSMSRGMASPMLSPSSPKLDLGFTLRREGSTGSGRAICMSPSARKRVSTTYQSGREEASSQPRQPLVTPSVLSTLSLDFETERNRRKEGTESEIVGITLFDNEDIARLSLIIGRKWNEEGNQTSKSINRTSAQKETPKPETELEKAPLSPLKDILKTRETVKPASRGSQSVTTQLATRESQLLPITEKSEETSDCAEDTPKPKSVARIPEDTHQPHDSTHIPVSIESTTAKRKSNIPSVLAEMNAQDLATPTPLIPPTPTSQTKKRSTRTSMAPVRLPEDFPVGALIRRAHIRRRTRVQAARVRPLPPLPCTETVYSSRKPSQRITLFTTREEGKIRPLPAIPCTSTALEGNSEINGGSGSSDAVENTWSGGSERHAIASALQLQIKLEKHDEHFLYDPQLFPRPSTSTSTKLSMNFRMRIGKPVAASPLIVSSSPVGTSPKSHSHVRGPSGPTAMPRQRRSSAPDHPTLTPSVRPTHTRCRSTHIKHELVMDAAYPGLLVLRMPHPPSSFRGVSRGGVTKPDGALTPTEYKAALSTSEGARPPSRSSYSSQEEIEPANQNKQHGAGTHNRVLVDRSVPDTPISGWFCRGPGRAPTPIDWELVDSMLGTKGMGRISYSSVKTLESLEKESISRSRKNSNTTIASRSSRSRSRGRPKRKSGIPLALRKLSGGHWMLFGDEEVPPLPRTSRTWA